MTYIESSLVQFIDDNHLIYKFINFDIYTYATHFEISIYVVLSTLYDATAIVATSSLPTEKGLISW